MLHKQRKKSALAERWYQLKHNTANYLHKIADKMESDGVLETDKEYKPLKKHTIVKFLAKFFK